MLGVLLFSSCAKLDLNPLSEGSSENWYSDETELSLSLNDLYRTYAWGLEIDYTTERMTDNWAQRQSAHSFIAGTINSEWTIAEEVWLNSYKAIARANTILANISRAEGKVAPLKLKQFAAEARFIRAALYGRLIFLYGDVPFYTTVLDIESAFALSRTDKAVILKEVYKDFDLAMADLPQSYSSSEIKRATKGAAMAFKARTALYMGDWAIARDAAKACMDLNAYQLHSNYGEYFLSKTKNSAETIFAIPRSFELGVSWNAKNFYTRTPGGSSVAQPSWDIFCAYTCKDGLPIDESPLFDPKLPFKNRDPRCAMSIVEFGTAHLGYVYDPNPATRRVLNFATGATVPNKDTRSVDVFASYNGLTLKKGVDSDWSDNELADADIIIMRYADVLLMYAEAKIELNEIDATVLSAINSVRSRAYGVPVTSVNSYPAVTSSSQVAIRKILRNERRVELMWENRRFDDLIRWRLAEKALTRPNYGLLDPADLLSNIVNKGLWFFPSVPQIDEDGLADFSAMANAKQIKVLVPRNFDKSKQYLWPIPSKERIINQNLTQNPNY